MLAGEYPRDAHATGRAGAQSPAGTLSSSRPQGATCVRSGRRTVVDEHLAVDDRRRVAARPLHVAAGAGREVVDELGQLERQARRGRSR